MIRGYPAHASVQPGGELVLHVATDAPRFRVAFGHWHDGFRCLHTSPWLPGKDAEEMSADADWAWPRYSFDIPRDWPSGVYLAHLQEAEPLPLDAWMPSAAALFVVRGDGVSPILYKIPLSTYHAYNCSGDGCFYSSPPRSADPPGSRVSFRRPGGGTGGPVHGALDHYDDTSPRQTFAHWDARFIRWLARCGFEAEFCTDLDIHRDGDLLQRHRLVLSVGHDEYWSEPTRDAHEAFVQRGGNLAFFGANLCWWRVHVVDDGSAMVCHQGGPRGALDHWWPPTGAHRPEDALSGVSYRHGGGWWDGPRTSAGFVVQDGSHWLFDGTGLCTGDRFGADTSPPLVGYECDGAPFDGIDETSGFVRLSHNAQRFGTPAGFRALAVAVLDGRWQELPHREGLGYAEGVHSATMGLHTRGGTVFTAGTTDWSQVLCSGCDPRVERMTRNVIERLLVA